MSVFKKKGKFRCFIWLLLVFHMVCHVDLSQSGRSWWIEVCRWIDNIPAFHPLISECFCIDQLERIGSGSNIWGVPGVIPAGLTEISLCLCLVPVNGATSNFSSKQHAANRNILSILSWSYMYSDFHMWRAHIRKPRTTGI